MTSQPTGSSMPTPAVQGETARTAGNGVPMFVSADPDLAAKPGSNQDSWFYLFHLDSRRGTLDLLIHVLRIAPPGRDGTVQALVSLLDPLTGTYRSEEAIFPPSACQLSDQCLEVSTPTCTLSGNSSGMHVRAAFSQIATDLHLVDDGPLMACMGTGLFPLLGDINYEYAMTDMTVTGTVVIDDETYDVTGSCWLDRQWGVTPRFFDTEQPIRWVWMGIVLDNGDRISMSEVTEAGHRHSFATIVHLSGGHEIVAVGPLEEAASQPWTSPHTQNVYPTAWDITLPTLPGRLRVEPHVLDQEVQSAAGVDKYEGTARISGELRGEAVSGRVTVELVGAWT